METIPVQTEDSSVSWLDSVTRLGRGQPRAWGSEYGWSSGCGRAGPSLGCKGECGGPPTWSLNWRVGQRLWAPDVAPSKARPGCQGGENSQKVLVTFGVAGRLPRESKAAKSVICYLSRRGWMGLGVGPRRGNTWSLSLYLPEWVWGRPSSLVSRSSSMSWASTACEHAAGISTPAEASQPQGRLPGGGGPFGNNRFHGAPRHWAGRRQRGLPWRSSGPAGVWSRPPALLSRLLLAPLSAARAPFLRQNRNNRHH